MASPKKEIIFIYNLTTGAPLTGNVGSMSFDVYKDDANGSLSAPTITEIGTTGVYQFTPVFADPARGIVYILNAGAAANPRRIARYMRPEDYNSDNADVASSTLATATALTSVANAIVAVQADIDSLLDIELGEWRVEASGLDANRLVLLKPDGVTVIAKFDLKDANGVATTTDPFQRIPV